jgi:hypothetical protein
MSIWPTEREDRRSRLQLAAAQPYQPSPCALAQALRADLPTLLDRATAHERRLVLRSLFSEIWVRNAEIHELTPRADVYPLVTSIARCVSGVADGRLARRRHTRALSADVDGA